MLMTRDSVLYCQVFGVGRNQHKPNTWEIIVIGEQECTKKKPVSDKRYTRSFLLGDEILTLSIRSTVKHHEISLQVFS